MLRLGRGVLCRAGCAGRLCAWRRDPGGVTSGRRCSGGTSSVLGRGFGGGGVAGLGVADGLRLEACPGVFGTVCGARAGA